MDFPEPTSVIWRRRIFLDQDFRPQKVVPGLPSFTDCHTGENVAESV